MKKQLKKPLVSNIHISALFTEKCEKSCLKFDRLDLCSGAAALHTHQNRISTE